MLPVVIACVCVMLAVCLPDEEESLDAPVSGAQGGPPCRTLMSDKNRPESKKKKPSCKTKVHSRVFEPDEGVLNRLREECALCVLKSGDCCI